MRPITKCPIETVDHSACPPEMACIADPAAIIPGHDETAIHTRCGNAVAELHTICANCEMIFGQDDVTWPLVKA